MSDFSSIELVVLKDDEWFARQKVAGKCVASILKEAGKLIEDQTPGLSLRDIENMALEKMKEQKCTPTFLNYEGFPSAICASVNKGLVHGVVTDYELQPGDVVSIDLGATFEGAIADAARTWIYGEPKNKKHVRLLECGMKALQAGIGAVKIGEHLGSIGYAIHKYTKDTEFSSVVTYGGHGINYNEPHADPFVANRQTKGSGIIMCNGLSIAIEPMLVIGSPRTKQNKDGHTIDTADIGCHFENSVTIMNDEIHVMTHYE